jgi:hypothetical protein
MLAQSQTNGLLRRRSSVVIAAASLAIGIAVLPATAEASKLSRDSAAKIKVKAGGKHCRRGTLQVSVEGKRSCLRLVKGKAPARKTKAKSGERVARTSSIYGATTVNAGCVYFNYMGYPFAVCETRTYYPITRDVLYVDTWYQKTSSGWIRINTTYSFGTY